MAGRQGALLDGGLAFVGDVTKARQTVSTMVPKLRLTATYHLWQLSYNGKRRSKP